ncbi:MAG TPA: hypothetical protein VGW76_09120, partial [Pyrinomonadaceae bacterium]|nr:hypothetical protein [Pyrinomonadaceae bacterium]
MKSEKQIRTWDIGRGTLERFGFIFAATFLLAFIFVTSAFAARTERLVDGWKPTNYKVSLTFNDALTEITSAKTEITIVALKDSLGKIDLDFGD